jgi:hypothetical protein
MAKQYSNYSQQLDVFFRSGMASTFLLYVQTLPELCRADPYLISSISNSCLDVLQAMCTFLNTVDKKYVRQLAGKK